jgi:hypothetical protein
MPEQRFSISESCALLDIDRVTLSRWLAAEGMRPQPDPRDKRFKYLSREQLLTLARAHDRAIREDMSVSGPRLTVVQREMLARIQALEERIAELAHWKEERENVRQRLLEPRQAALAPVTAPEYTYTPETHYSAVQHGTGGAKRKLSPGEWRTLPPIPPGWRIPLDVARELGIPQRTFSHAMRPRYDNDTERRGTLDYHEGLWQHPHPGNYATELLDPDQQEAARERFSGRPTG